MNIVRYNARIPSIVLLGHAAHITSRHADDAEFKESDHPRQPDGKFGKGSGSSSSSAAPKGMEHLVSSPHKSVASLCYAAIAEGKWSNQQIAEAAKAKFGGKTSPASVSWYKMQVKHNTPAGKKALAEHVTAVKANDTSIKQAAKTPAPQAQVNQVIAQGVASTSKTMYVNATDASGKTVYLKLAGVPSGLDSQKWVAKALKPKGYEVQLTSKWDASKPAPPNVIEQSLNFAESDKLQNEAYAEAAEAAKVAEAAEAANKAFTTQEAGFNEAIIKSLKAYTNGSYSKLNTQLRTGQPMDEATATLAAHIDEALLKSKTHADCVVYRGVKEPQKFFGPSPKVGTIVVDNGYISTSKSKDIGEEWAGFSGLVAVIRIPKGAKALDVHSISLYSHENEVLLPRATMFKLTGINGKFVELEYVNV